MKKPMYVKIGLFAVPTKKAAKGYMYFTILLALLSLVASVVLSERYFVGVGFLLAAFWYKISIKWMDDNNGWGVK